MVEIGPLNSVSPPNCRSCSPQTSASGFSSERSAVEVTGRGYAHRRGHGRRAVYRRRYQRTVSSRCAGCGVVPAKTTLNVYVPAGSAS